jgi:glycosyltransferase involved in cell wall biosynthesis
MTAETVSTSNTNHQPNAGAKPAVTWLIGTHVADEHLKQALESCFGQTFQDFECLVVVNGESAEEVTAKVTSWFGHDSRLRLVPTETSHLTFSLALGLHLARAPLVARMDSDDVSTPGRLASQIDFMATHPDVVVLGTQYDVINQVGVTVSHVELPTKDIDIRKRLLRGNPFCHPSVILRKDAVLKVGGYLGGIYAQDYDLWLRLARVPGFKFANLPTTGLKYRQLGIGSARASRKAYACVAGSQFGNFTAGFGLSWLLAAFISVGKALFRAKR